MRTKTRGGRARHSRQAIPKPSATTPVLHMDEAYAEYSRNRNSPETYSESHDEQYYDDDGGGDVAPDSVDETESPAKKGRFIGINGASMDIDWYKAETCFICDRSVGEMLVCCEIGCPIIVHDKCLNSELKFDDVWNVIVKEKCMNSELNFDGVENFYCPNCWYKQQVVQSKELMEKVMVAEKALLDFIDLDMVSSNERKRDIGNVECKETNLPLGGIGSDCKGNDELQDQQVYAVLHERFVEGQQGELPNACYQVEEKSAGGSLHVSNKDTCEGTTNVQGTTMSSTGSANYSIEIYSDAETLAVHQQRSQKKTPSKNIDDLKQFSYQPDPYLVGNSRNPECSNRLENITFPNEKRKRSCWTPEEEAKLREGVRKFSTERKKNIPWRKILEFGCPVFHGTRNPADLKDKWKNIMAKESSTINRR